MEEVAENPTAICESFLEDMAITDPSTNTIIDQLQIHSDLIDMEPNRWDKHCIDTMTYLNDVQHAIEICYDHVPRGEPVKSIKNKGCKLYQFCDQMGLWTKFGRAEREKYEEPEYVYKQKYESASPEIQKQYSPDEYAVMQDLSASIIPSRELKRPTWFCKL